MARMRFPGRPAVKPDKDLALCHADIDQENSSSLRSAVQDFQIGLTTFENAGERSEEDCFNGFGKSAKLYSGHRLRKIEFRFGVWQRKAVARSNAGSVKPLKERCQNGSTSANRRVQNIIASKRKAVLISRKRTRPVSSKIINSTTVHDKDSRTAAATAVVAREKRSVRKKTVYEEPISQIRSEIRAARRKMVNLTSAAVATDVQKSTADPGSGSNLSRARRSRGVPPAQQEDVEQKQPPSSEVKRRARGEGSRVSRGSVELERPTEEMTTTAADTCIARRRSKVKVKLKVKPRSVINATRSKMNATSGRKARSKLSRASRPDFGRKFVSRHAVAKDGKGLLRGVIAKGRKGLLVVSRHRGATRSFVLPNVSARSSRKIVPTKRFIEEFEGGSTRCPKRPKLEDDVAANSEADSAAATSARPDNVSGQPAAAASRSKTGFEGKALSRSSASVSASDVAEGTLGLSHSTRTKREPNFIELSAGCAQVAVEEPAIAAPCRRRRGRPPRRAGTQKSAEVARSSGSLTAAARTGKSILVKARRQLSRAQKIAQKRAEKQAEKKAAQPDVPCVCCICGRATPCRYYGMPACTSCKRFFQRYIIRPTLPARITECVQSTGEAAGRCTALIPALEDYCATCHFNRCISKFPSGDRLKAQPKLLPVISVPTPLPAASISLQLPVVKVDGQVSGSSDVGAPGDPSHTCDEEAAAAADDDAVVAATAVASSDGAGVNESSTDKPSDDIEHVAKEASSEQDLPVLPVVEPVAANLPVPDNVSPQVETASSVVVRTPAESGPRIKHVCRSANVAQGTPARYPPNTVPDIRLSALPQEEKTAILKREELEDDTDDDDDDGKSYRPSASTRDTAFAVPLPKPAPELKGAAAAACSSPSGSTAPLPSANAGKPYMRMRRCEKCENCLRPCCGKCTACRNMAKFGGPGTLKKPCTNRYCLNPVYCPSKGGDRSGEKRRHRKRPPPRPASPGAESTLLSTTMASVAEELTSSRDAVSLDDSATNRNREADRSKQLAPIAVVAASAGPVQRISQLQAAQDEAAHRIFVDVKAGFFDMRLVWQHGAPLIFTSAACTRTLCYLCGSSGNYEFLFCAVCCEPFHEFCLAEEERLKADEVDWVCKKCQFCSTCGQQGTLLKCARCSDTYHASCLTPGHPSKPTRTGTWVCSHCVRCKSCGTTTSGSGAAGARWTDDFNLCHDCGKLKAKGNMCPICECCYADDDWDSKMVQCSGCNSWVHAKCEQISDEMYEMMSGLPDDEAPYQCHGCCTDTAIAGTDGATQVRPWLQTMANVLQRGLRRVISSLLALKCAHHLVHSGSSAEYNSSLGIASEAAPAGDLASIVCGVVADNAVQTTVLPDMANSSDMLAPTWPSVSVQGEVTMMHLSDAGHDLLSSQPMDMLPDEPQSMNLLLGQTRPANLLPGEVQPTNSLACQPCDVLPSNPVDLTLSQSMDIPHGQPVDSLLGQSAGLPSGQPMDLLPGQPPDFSSVSRLVEEGAYSRVVDFAEDVVRIISRAFEQEQFQVPVFAQYNHIVQYTFIKEMQCVFSWFDVKNESLWAAKINLHSSPKEGASAGSSGGDEEDTAIDDDTAEDVGTSAAAAAEDSIVTGGTDTVADGAAAEDMSATSDLRRCVLCMKHGDGQSEECGRLLYAGQDDWVHVNCAIWSAEVFEEVDGTLQNVQAAFTRGRQLECEKCKSRGATVGCCLRGCSANFHFMCARRVGCAFQEDKKMFCFRHVRHVDGMVIEGNRFCVSRAVIIDFRQAKVSKKAWHQGLHPKDIRVSVGSLTLDYLGQLTALSDGQPLLLPIGYCVRRTFWSTVQPFKRCEYTCRIVEVKPPPEEKPADVVIQEMTINHDARLPNYVAPADLHKVLPAICRPSSGPVTGSNHGVGGGARNDGARCPAAGRKKRPAPPRGTKPRTSAVRAATDYSPTPSLAAAVSSSQLPARGVAAGIMMNAASAAKSSGSFASSSWPGTALTPTTMTPPPASPIQPAEGALAATLPSHGVLSQSWPLRQTMRAPGVDLNKLSEKTRRQLGCFNLTSMSAPAHDDELEDVSTLTLFASTLNKAAAKHSKKLGGANELMTADEVSRSSSTDTAPQNDPLDDDGSNSSSSCCLEPVIGCAALCNAPTPGGAAGQPDAAARSNVSDAPETVNASPHAVGFLPPAGLLSIGHDGADAGRQATQRNGELTASHAVAKESNVEHLTLPSGLAMPSVVSNGPWAQATECVSAAAVANGMPSCAARRDSECSEPVLVRDPEPAARAAGAPLSCTSLDNRGLTRAPIFGDFIDASGTGRVEPTSVAAVPAATVATPASPALTQPVLLPPPKIIITDFSYSNRAASASYERNDDALGSESTQHDMAADSPGLPCSDSTRDKLRTLVRRKSDPALCVGMAADGVASAVPLLASFADTSNAALSVCDIASAPAAEGSTDVAMSETSLPLEEAIEELELPGEENPVSAPSRWLQEPGVGCGTMWAQNPVNAASTLGQKDSMVSSARQEQPPSEQIQSQLGTVLNQGQGRPSLVPTYSCAAADQSYAPATVQAAEASVLGVECTVSQPVAIGNVADTRVEGQKMTIAAVWPLVNTQQHTAEQQASSIDSLSMLAGRPRLQSLLVSAPMSKELPLGTSTVMVSQANAGVAGQSRVAVSLLDRQLSSSSQAGSVYNGVATYATTSQIPTSVSITAGGASVGQPASTARDQPGAFVCQTHQLLGIPAVTFATAMSSAPAVSAQCAMMAQQNDNIGAATTVSAISPGMSLCGIPGAPGAPTVVPADACNRKTYLGSLRITPNGQIIGLDVLNSLVNAKGSCQVTVTHQMVQDVVNARGGAALAGGCSIVVQLPQQQQNRQNTAAVTPGLSNGTLSSGSIPSMSDSKGLPAKRSMTSMPIPPKRMKLEDCIGDGGVPRMARTIVYPKCMSSGVATRYYINGNAEAPGMWSNDILQTHLPVAPLKSKMVRRPRTVVEDVVAPSGGASLPATLASLSNDAPVPLNIDTWIRETAAARVAESERGLGPTVTTDVRAPATGSSGVCRQPRTVGPCRKARPSAPATTAGGKRAGQAAKAERRVSKLMFEITSDDGFFTQAECYADAWRAVVNSVQEARQQWATAASSTQGGLRRRRLSFMAVKGAAMFGLDHYAVIRLIEQIYGARLCRRYEFRYYRPAKVEIEEEPPENLSGCARSEAMCKPRPPFEMFAFLHSQYRTMRTDLSKQNNDVELSQKSSRRATSMELPVAMRYRALQEKNHAKEAVGVYRSGIHGRGLFCMRPIDAGEMIIEYAGEVIRSSLTDVREKFYESKGIGCYMFRIDEFEVVDATMRGNASRFINHCCEPNCYSRIITVENKKHIVIYASRAIKPGEELTYDYKFPFEEIKIPCNCGVRRCRKYLN